MRKSYLVLILCALAITIVLLLTACSKAGPKGASGPAGPQGPAGQQGTPGPAGSQLFEGSGVPAVALGNVGDFYINGQTDSLYGPKTLSGWGTGISLQGTAGAAGTPGAAGAPGTANVIYYNWTAFNETNWGDFDPFNSTREYQINMPALTSQILNQGVALVYLEYVQMESQDTVSGMLVDQRIRGRTGYKRRSAYADL